VEESWFVNAVMAMYEGAHCTDSS